jgi:hypothetical protein
MDESAATVDATSTSDTPSSTTPDSAATPESTAAPEAAATTAQPVESAEKIDWDSFDLEDLTRRSPKLARRLNGKAGELAQRQAAQLLEQQLETRKAQWQADWAAQQREAELDKLADEDPYAFAEKSKAIKAEKQEAERKAEEDRLQQTNRQKIESDAINAVYGEVDLSLWDFYETLPGEIKTQIAGKRYDGTRREAYVAFLADVKTRMEKFYEGKAVEAKEAGKKEARDQWVKSEKPKLVDAARRDALSDAVAQDGTPDVSEGSAANGHLSQDEFDRHRHDQKWLDANYDRMMEAAVTGRIRH